MSCRKNNDMREHIPTVSTLYINLRVYWYVLYLHEMCCDYLVPILQHKILKI